MVGRHVLLKFLAILAVIFIFFPVIWAFIAAIFGLIVTGVFTFSFLLTGLFFPFSIVGIVILIIVALLARSFMKLVILAAVIAIIFFGGQAIYGAVSGLWAGNATFGAFLTGTVLGISVYWIVIVVLGIIGLMLIARLFRRH